MRGTETTVPGVLLTAVLELDTKQGDKLKVMGPTHPRAFTIAQREQIIKDGLGDQEESVRTAASSLIGTWIDVVNIAAVKSEQDVGGVAADALLSVFTTCPDILGSIQFHVTGKNLTPGRPFLARVFVEHCIATKDEIRLETVLPVVTALAFSIQQSYNTLLDALQAFIDDKLVPDFDDAELQEREEDLYNKELVFAEMLKLAVNLDCSDEIGKRKMLQLVRDMSSMELLPESLVGCCLDVLRKLSVDEEDLIQVVESIVDPGDPIMDEPEEPVVE